MTPLELRERGIEALTKALGPVGMARFLQEFTTGSGDYTQEREQWLEGLTVRNVVQEIQRNRQATDKQ
jgi:hypothetical protein